MSERPSMTEIPREDVRDLFGTRKALEAGLRAERRERQELANPSLRAIHQEKSAIRHWSFRLIKNLLKLFERS